MTEFRFHATAIYASGGMILSGDDLTKIESYRLQMLQKLLPPTGVAATFADDSMNIGIVSLAESKMVCVLNWEDETRSFRFKLSRVSEITDYWTGERFGKREGWFTVNDVSPHTAVLLRVT